MLKNVQTVVNMSKSDSSIILEFSKEEIAIIKSKIYLNDLQKKILDMKLDGNLTEYGMAMELGVSESTIQYQWRKIKKKILKVI